LIDLGRKGRKSQYVERITTKDRRMLSGLARVGYMGLRQLNEDMGISMNRIKNFVREGYIIRSEHVYKPTGNGMPVFNLTDKGKNLCSRETALIQFYISASASHDLALSQKYSETEEEYQCRWIVEMEWRDRFRAEFGIEPAQLNMSPPDGGYITSSGELVAIEVVTSSYTDEDIQSKIEFCEKIGATYTEVRI
jgi:DNA-binding Lrp family transcriptional regulator